jgi:hypothetical protein
MSGGSAGSEAVRALHRVLEPPAERVAEEAADGFTWWPHAHAQRIAASDMRADGACIVSAEIVLLAGVAGRGPELAALALRNAREPGLSGLRWDSERGTVSLRAAVVVRAGDGGAAARRLSHAALLQIGEALRVADELAVAFPAAAPVTGLDAAGREWEAVETAESWRTYAHGAAEAAASLAAAIARLPRLAPAPWVRAAAAAHGVDAELACRAGGAGAAPGEGLALLRLSDRQPHPRLGAGLVAVLVLPPDAEPVAERAAATAALLNEAESREWTGADQLGAWCVHPMAGLSHVQFLPALAVEEDSLERLAWQAGARARWATAFLERIAALRAEGGARG